jgi:hypothetical protein
MDHVSSPQEQEYRFITPLQGAGLIVLSMGDRY